MGWWECVDVCKYGKLRFPFCTALFGTYFVNSCDKSYCNLKGMMDSSADLGV